MFRRTFSVPKHAASALKTMLPEDLVKRIKWDKLRSKSGSFSDAKLTNRYSDVLFEVEIDDDLAFIYVLYEHKSEPEKWTLLQLLEYMVRIWRAYLRERGGKKVDRLPIILPVVLHHGQAGWTAARRFIEYFGSLEASLRPYVPNFAILLDDVGKVNPDDLLARPLTAEAKVVLLCLLLGRTPERLFEELPKWHEPLSEVWREQDGALVFSAVIVYMNQVARIPEEEITMALQHSLKLTPAEEIFFADEVLRQRALRKGLREGRREGRREGQQELLLKLLRQRFGELPTEATATIQAATLAELEDMGLRVLNAATLEDVLGKPAQKRK
ncbi:MAG: Rpn family recombination-promoting nuclease/putative transposase [Polyangiaceae bacterium]|nr:Rpn family recombination-promoting nuclease/putative transposase [Polyangiaceae bacterium]